MPPGASMTARPTAAARGRAGGPSGVEGRGNPCPPRARSAGCPTDGGNEHPKAVRSTMGGEHPSGAKWKPLVDAARQRLLLLRTGLDSPDLNRRPLDLEKSPPEPPARSRPAIRAPVSSVGPGERVVCRVFELCRANAVGALSAPTATRGQLLCSKTYFDQSGRPDLNRRLTGSWLPKTGEGLPVSITHWW